MEYKLVYSERRTLGLTVKDGQLTVHAPFGVKTSYIEKLLEQKQNWIEKNVKNQRAKLEKMRDISEKEILNLKKEAKNYFSKKTYEYSEIMNLHYNSVKITSAKSRFGSCNTKGNICFSYRLMLYPERAREYVIVHELAHLKYMNHSKDFYNYIEKYMSDYKEREKLLK